MVDLPNLQAGTVQVLNPATGAPVNVRGVGVLQGRLHLDKSIDITKPIAAQALARASTAGQPGEGDDVDPRSTL